MYPCSNPELVAAASAAGAIGVIQPHSLVYVYGHDFRAGLRLIRELSGGRPVGLNVLVEKAAKAYENRMRHWVDIAIEEGVRFFVTALGDPEWVVNRAKEVGGVVYHDVTERRFAERALERGAEGLICVNSRAGGHAGGKSPAELYEELVDFGVPLICAGGIGTAAEYAQALQSGYAGVQMGTRFIASRECGSHPDYKAAIVKAKAADIVLTDRISGVPVAVIKTPYIEKVGTKAGWLGRRLLKGRRTKHMMRALYMLQSVWQLKRASLQGMNYKDYFQAGKSVEGIEAVESVAEIVERFASAARALDSAPVG
ncbi:MAG: nitronate monooxygenase [Planctomycetes bacterium]|nr:nitronate monooxygenase [Planctomycetota bacterium]